MSKLTDSILSFVEYEKARENRRHNFVTLHNNLKEYNELNIQLGQMMFRWSIHFL